MSPLDHHPFGSVFPLIFQAPLVLAAVTALDSTAGSAASQSMVEIGSSGWCFIYSFWQSPLVIIPAST